MSKKREEEPSFGQIAAAAVLRGPGAIFKTLKPKEQPKDPFANVEQLPENDLRRLGGAITEYEKVLSHEHGTDIRFIGVEQTTNQLVFAGSHTVIKKDGTLQKVILPYHVDLDAAEHFDEVVNDLLGQDW